VYIISSYLKTAVVGLHDNSDPIVWVNRELYAHYWILRIL
jgi:hypothetical protein